MFWCESCPRAGPSKPAMVVRKKNKQNPHNSANGPQITIMKRPGTQNSINNICDRKNISFAESPLTTVVDIPIEFTDVCLPTRFLMSCCYCGLLTLIQYFMRPRDKWTVHEESPLVL